MESIYLSVVLSTFNDEKYLGKSIESILNQTYPFFEFIIINDGSTDHTAEIIQSFNDPRIVFVNKANTGLIDSLNIGVAKAKYEWIARMDGDDIAEPNRLEEEVKMIAENICLISSQCNLIDKNGSPIGKTKFLSRGLGRYISLELRFPLIAHPTVLFRKQTFLEVGGYDSCMQIAEDIDLWLKMLSKGKLVVCSQCLLKSRKHDKNISILQRQEQIINGVIAYIKFVHGINRCLTIDEYNALRYAVVNSTIFRNTISKDRRGIWNVCYREMRTWCYIRFNVEIIKVVKWIKGKNPYMLNEMK